MPKGVILTHYNIVANCCQVQSPPSPLRPPVTLFSRPSQILAVEGDTTIFADSVIAGVLPFFHIYGFTVLLMAGIYQGAKTIVFPKFDLPEFLKLVVVRIPELS